MPRPAFKPTDEQRKLVKSLAAMGTPQEQIARKVGLRSPKTVRKHFRDELDLGATEANYMVAKTLHQMATSGKHPSATIFWMKSRVGWREGPAAAGTVQAPDFIVEREREDGAEES